MNKVTQQQRMIREMRKRKVKNYEFAKMYIMSYTKRISEIRDKGIIVNKERVYDSNGKATGVFQYWIPRKRRVHQDKSYSVDGMHYETPKLSTGLFRKVLARK